jgi:hypothetical protein
LSRRLGLDRSLFRVRILLRQSGTGIDFFFEYFRLSCQCNSISAAPSSSFMYSSYGKDKWAKPGILLLGCVVSGMSREVDKNCALLGYYAASISNFLPTFRDILWLPSSRFKNKNKACSPNTEFINRGLWAVKSLSSVVSVNRLILEP